MNMNADMHVYTTKVRVMSFLPKRTIQFTCGSHFSVVQCRLLTFVVSLPSIVVFSCVWCVWCVLAWRIYRNYSYWRHTQTHTHTECVYAFFCQWVFVYAWNGKAKKKYKNVTKIMYFIAKIMWSFNEQIIFSFGF